MLALPTQSQRMLAALLGAMALTACGSKPPADSQSSTLGADSTGKAALAVSLAGSGSGTVASTPAGLSCSRASGAVCSAGFDLGSTVTLAETADSGSRFAGWSGGGATCGTASTCDVSLSAATSVTATFVAQVALTVAPGSGGSLSASSGGSTVLDCASSSCSATLDSGTEVILTATPATGYAFLSWGGACSGSSTTCTVTLSTAQAVSATFSTQLTVSATPSGYGSVGTSPTGAGCGAGCQAFAVGSVVTLTATPTTGHRFVGWSGACSGSNAVCNVTLSAARSATATFDVALWALSVETSGAGRGTVSGTVGSTSVLSCTRECSASLPLGTTVTLTATPDANSTFAAWGGGCSGTSSTCSVTLEAATSVTATFNRGSHTLTAASSGPGRVVSSPAGIDCGTACTAAFDSGSVITLTATPNANAVFVGWSGACTIGLAQCNVSLTDTRTATATFAPQLYPALVDFAGGGHGTVTANPGTLACSGQGCAGYYEHGTPVTFTVTPDDYSYLVGWSGGCSGRSCQVIVNGPQRLVLTLARKQLSVSVTIEGAGRVETSTAGTPAPLTSDLHCEGPGTCTGTLEAGRVYTFTATPETGGSFAEWTGGICATSLSQCNVLMASDISLGARFGAQGGTPVWTPSHYTVIFNAEGGSSPSPATASVTFGSTYGTLATTSLSGYTFAGWWTGAGGTGALVTSDTTVVTTGDHTLHAKWDANHYTVTFNAEGGSSPSPATASVAFGSAYGTLATTSLSGYTFAGWWTGAGTGTQVSPETTVATVSDHTLHARWTASSGGTSPVASALSVSGSSTLAAGTCSPYVVTTTDSSGNPAEVTAATVIELTGGGAGAFYGESDPTCAAAPVASATLTALSSSKTVYFRDTSAQTLSLSFARSSGELVGSTTGQVTIAPQAPAQLHVSVAATATTGQCVAVTVASLDTYGNPSSVSGVTNIGLDDGVAHGSFYSEDTCSAGVGSTTLTVGQTSRVVYYLSPVAETATLTASASGLGSGTGSVALSQPTTTCCSSSIVPEVGGVVTWLKADAIPGLADGASVTTWSDSGGAGRDATGSGTTRPVYKTSIVNGLPVVRFAAASSQTLSLPSTITPPASTTIFAVVSAATYNQDRFIFGGRSGTLASWGSVGITADGNCPGAFKYSLGNGAQSTTNGACPSISAAASLVFPGNNTFVVLSYQYTTGSSRPNLWANGLKLSVPPASGTATSVTGAATPFSLGRSGNDTTYFSGDIAELVVFDSALSEGNRQRVEGYLLQKYGFKPRFAASVAIPATTALTQLATYGGSGAFSYSVVAGAGRINGSAQFEAPTAPSFTFVKSRDANGAEDYMLVQTGEASQTLKTWVKPETINQSASSALCTWRDSSANGLHSRAAYATATLVCGTVGSFTAPTYGSNTLNSRSVVTFNEGSGTYQGNGQSMFFGTQLGVPTTTGYTLVGVASRNFDPSASVQPFLWGSYNYVSTTFTGSAWGMLQFLSASGMRYFFTNNTSDSAPNVSKGATDASPMPSRNIPYVLTQRHKSGDAFDEIFSNGVKSTATTSVTSGPTNPGTMAQDFAIGGPGHYLYRYWDGDVAEVMIFFKTLSAAELNVVHQYLGTKYGITVSALQ